MDIKCIFAFIPPPYIISGKRHNYYLFIFVFHSLSVFVFLMVVADYKEQTDLIYVSFSFSSAHHCMHACGATPLGRCTPRQDKADGHAAGLGGILISSFSSQVPVPWAGRTSSLPLLPIKTCFSRFGFVGGVRCLTLTPAFSSSCHLSLLSLEKKKIIFRHG